MPVKTYLKKGEGLLGDRAQENICMQWFMVVPDFRPDISPMLFLLVF
jgi:hypothetical protein